MAHGSRKSIARNLESLSDSRDSCQADTAQILNSTRPEFSSKLGPVVNRERLKRCQEILLTAFRTCQSRDSENLACTISCTQNSSRCLHISELQDAVAMHACAQDSRHEWMNRSSTDFRGWLAKFGALFAVDDMGYVAFGIAEVSYFLRSFRIRGIDGSHRTIAMICLAFVEQKRPCSMSSIASPFSSYAAQYWEYHYRIASKSSISLRYEPPAQKCARSEKRQTPVHRSQEHSYSPSDPVRIYFERLDVEDETEGWVSVNKDGSDWRYV